MVNDSEQQRPADQLPDQAEWCLGIKSAGSRRLTAQECSQLQAETKRYGRRELAAGCGCPLAFLTSLMLCVAIGEWLQRLSWLQQGGNVLLFLPFVPAVWLALIVSDAWTWRRAVRRALAAGTVKRFRGHTDAPGAWDALVRLRNDSGDDDELEVFAGAPFVFKVNGLRAPACVRVGVAQVAELPAAVTTMVRRIGRTVAVDGNGQMYSCRELSAMEVEELRQQSRLRWRPLPFLLLLNGFLLGSLLLALWFGAPLHPDSDSLLFSAVVLILDIAVAHSIWVARRLNQDARRGIVVVIPLFDQSPT